MTFQARGGAPQYQVWLQKVTNKHSAEGMSQMAAMRMSDFYQKRLTAQEIMMYLPIVTFPLFLQTHYIKNIAVV